MNQPLSELTSSFNTFLQNYTDYCNFKPQDRTSFLNHTLESYLSNIISDLVIITEFKRPIKNISSPSSSELFSYLQDLSKKIPNSNLTYQVIRNRTISCMFQLFDTLSGHLDPESQRIFLTLILAC